MGYYVFRSALYNFCHVNIIRSLACMVIIYSIMIKHTTLTYMELKMGVLVIIMLQWEFINVQVIFTCDTWSLAKQL